MLFQKLSPAAGDGGAGRVCLQAGARSVLTPAAFAAQCPIIVMHWLREPDFDLLDTEEAEALQ